MLVEDESKTAPKNQLNSSSIRIYSDPLDIFTKDCLQLGPAPTGPQTKSQRSSS